MSFDPFEIIPGDAGSGLLLIADHASARVPEGVDLGIDPALMREHVAIDIGVAELGARLCAMLGCPGVLGAVSRLVIDLNREEDAAGLIPVASDGHAIPGNEALDGDARNLRVERYWRPYHATVAGMIEEGSPRMLISLHSFTPRLASRPEEQRPWEVGVLYNQDERAARIAMPLLAEAGAIVGDNQPYSGKLLNATMNLHGEARGIPYLGLEVRQDLIGEGVGVARWAELLAPVIAKTRDSLA